MVLSGYAPATAGDPARFSVRGVCGQAVLVVDDSGFFFGRRVTEILAGSAGSRWSGQGASQDGREAVDQTLALPIRTDSP